MPCYLDDIVAIARGGSPRPIKSFITEDPDGLNWIKIGDSVRGSRYISSTEQRIKREGLSKTREVFPGDLILSNSMSFGFPYILKINGCIHDGWLVIRTPKVGVNKLFLSLLFQSPYARAEFTEAASGAVVQNLNADKVRLLKVALPPKEEQERIVSKVDELMNCCDQLEYQTESSIEAHKTLVETLLATLTNAKDTDELNVNWQRISEYFDTLFTTEDSIDQLKQTILQLAVMGKLVKQDPNDEPASALLERIAEEKEQLIKDKKIKKQKALPPISEDDKPFELPESWEWCRLPDVGELNRGKSKHRPRNDQALFEGGDIPLVQTGDVARAKETIETYTNKYNEFGLSQSRLWPKGTLCITIAANIADTAILGFDACFPDSVVGYTPYIETIDVKYFDYYLRTAKEHLEEFAPSTAQKNINLEILGQLLVPLPPESEINKIVGKIKDLFAVCDNLKLKLEKSRGTQVLLADAISSSLVKS